MNAIRYHSGFLDFVHEDKAFIHVSSTGNRPDTVSTESLVTFEFTMPSEHMLYDLKDNDFVDFLTAFGGISLSCFILGYILVNFAS